MIGPGYVNPPSSFGPSAPSAFLALSLAQPPAIAGLPPTSLPPSMLAADSLLRSPQSLASMGGYGSRPPAVVPRPSALHHPPMTGAISSAVAASAASIGPPPTQPQQRQQNQQQQPRASAAAAPLQAAALKAPALKQKYGPTPVTGGRPASASAPTSRPEGNAASRARTSAEAGTAETPQPAATPAVRAASQPTLAAAPAPSWLQSTNAGSLRCPATTMGTVTATMSPQDAALLLCQVLEQHKQQQGVRQQQALRPQQPGPLAFPPPASLPAVLRNLEQGGWPLDLRTAPETSFAARSGGSGPPFNMPLVPAVSAPPGMAPSQLSALVGGAVPPQATSTSAAAAAARAARAGAVMNTRAASSAGGSQLDLRASGSVPPELRSGSHCQPPAGRQPSLPLAPGVIARPELLRPSGSPAPILYCPPPGCGSLPTSEVSSPSAERKVRQPRWSWKCVVFLSSQQADVLHTHRLSQLSTLQ